TTIKCSSYEYCSQPARLKTNRERPHAINRDCGAHSPVCLVSPCIRIVPAIKGQARCALSLRQKKRLSPFGRTFRFLLLHDPCDAGPIRQWAGFALPPLPGNTYVFPIKFERERQRGK